MSGQGLIGQILNTWRVHNRINLYLLQEIPEKGFQAVPLGSRGRNVAQQFSHESHHRGQVALALKQSGMRLPEKVGIVGLWQQWYWGEA